MINAVKIYQIIILFFLEVIFVGKFTMSQIKNDNKTKIEPVTITVIYDNNPFLKGLQTDWGFACLVEFGKTKLLFDTGDDGNILISNLEKLDINPKDIDFIFLSHFHHDHTGGLKEFLKKNSHVTIYYPQSFPAQIVEDIIKSGAKPFPISSFKELQTNIFSLGELGSSIPEQSLAIRTSKGIVVITGCAHPGIVNILENAKIFFTDELIYLAMGGFHLHRNSADEINKVLTKIIDLRIHKVAPSHCSGDTARKMFKAAFVDNYIEIGTGRIFEIK